MTETTNQQLIRIMNNARVKLPGATDAALKYETFNVLDEFLRGSSVWSEDVEFDVNDEDQDYPIVGNSGQILRLVGVVNASDSPVPALMYEPGTITLSTVPGQEETFTATVVKTVVDPVANDGYPDLPYWILMKYMPDLTDGLIYKMAAQKAKPFSDPVLAIFHGKKFMNAIAMANVDRLHAHTQDAQSWSFPSFR